MEAPRAAGESRELGLTMCTALLVGNTIGIGIFMLPASLAPFGLNALDAEARQDLLEILEERYGCRSTLVTSQLPIDHWHGVIGNPTYADAILDRLIHNAHRIDLTGESLRKKRSKSVKDG